MSCREWELVEKVKAKPANHGTGQTSANRRSRSSSAITPSSCRTPELGRQPDSFSPCSFQGLSPSISGGSPKLPNHR